LTSTSTDIDTELARLRAENAGLRLRDHRCRAILASAADYAVVAIDAANRVMDWNAGATAVTGWEESEIVGRDAGALYTREDREARLPAAELARARAGERLTAERWHLRRDGTRFWAAVTLGPLQEVNPDEPGALLILQDRTARRAVEQRLHESEARFDELARTIDQVFWIADPGAGRLVYVSPAYERIWGRKPTAVLQSLEAWIDTLHPDDQPALRAALAAPGEAFQLAARLPHPAGGERQVRIRGWASEGGRIAGIAEDRTEQMAGERNLRESEARLKAVFEAMPLGLLVAEAPSGRILAGNSQIAEMFGATWPRSPDVPAYAVWECFHADGSRVRPEEYPLARALQGETRPVLEMLRRCPDDTRAWIRATGAPVHDEDGRLIGAVVAVQDIDLEKRLGDAVRDSNVRLRTEVADGLIALRERQRRLDAEVAQREAAESKIRQLQKMEAVGQLTGGIAHDFNNMLAVVISGLSLAQRRLARGEIAIEPLLDAAMDGARRAGALTQRLLAFSRKQPLSPVPLDANRLVRDMSELLRRTLGEAVQLETVLAGGLWRTIADPSQLENAIINLAVNARDAMEEGGRLTIETANCYLDDAYARDHAEVLAGQYVMIAVTDAGEGMPHEVLSRAFEPFFTTKEQGRGTGLGLSQVYGFIKQSSGHIKLYSEPGHGTTVKLYLPRHYGPEEVRPRDPAAETGTHGGEVLLVVEDDERVREMAVAGLRELGYTVLAADGGETALRLLAENPGIALLFTDIVMPGMSGSRLAAQARETRPDLRVLFTTGYTRNAVVHNGVLDTGVHLLTKPYTIEQLAAKLREVLGGET
jgi:PAS domain S-box-containing protein